MYLALPTQHISNSFSYLRELQAGWQHGQHRVLAMLRQMYAPDFRTPYNLFKIIHQTLGVHLMEA
jgi:hypothetical protein